MKKTSRLVMAFFGLSIICSGVNATVKVANSKNPLLDSFNKSVAHIKDINLTQAQQNYDESIRKNLGEIKDLSKLVTAFQSFASVDFSIMHRDFLNLLIEGRLTIHTEEDVLNGDDKLSNPVRFYSMLNCLIERLKKCSFLAADIPGFGDSVSNAVKEALKFLYNLKTSLFSVHVVSTDSFVFFAEDGTQIFNSNGAGAYATWVRDLTRPHAYLDEFLSDIQIDGVFKNCLAKFGIDKDIVFDGPVGYDANLAFNAQPADVEERTGGFLSQFILPGVENFSKSIYSLLCGGNEDSSLKSLAFLGDFIKSVRDASIGNVTNHFVEIANSGKRNFGGSEYSTLSDYIPRGVEVGVVGDVVSPFGLISDFFGKDSLTSEEAVKLLESLVDMSDIDDKKAAESMIDEIKRELSDSGSVSFDTLFDLVSFYMGYDIFSFLGKKSGLESFFQKISEILDIKIEDFDKKFEDFVKNSLPEVIALGLQALEGCGVAKIDVKSDDEESLFKAFQSILKNYGYMQKLTLAKLFEQGTVTVYSPVIKKNGSVDNSYDYYTASIGDNPVLSFYKAICISGKLVFDNSNYLKLYDTYSKLRSDSQNSSLKINSLLVKKAEALLKVKLSFYNSNSVVGSSKYTSWAGIDKLPGSANFSYEFPNLVVKVTKVDSKK